MLKIIPPTIFTRTADLLLPDLCAICRQTLTTTRASKLSIPLCNSCRTQADGAIINNIYNNIERCSACGYPLSSETGICCQCREKNWNFNSASSIFFYFGIGKKLIKAYKFDNRKYLANYFAALIYEYHLKNFPEYSIVPVPYRPSSKRSRGWDQIEAITQILQSKYHLPIVNCLRRKNGRAQKTMNYSNRMQNLENRISLRKNLKSPQNVLLVDDVFTTGATMNACSLILRKEGSVDIRCISLALDL